MLPAIGGENRVDRYSEMMVRYLGPTIIEAFADDDVTEIYINPQDSVIRFDTRSQGRIDSGRRIEPVRAEMFLNAAASSLGTTIGGANPVLEGELPTEVFRGSRIQGFVPPVTRAPAFVIRKPATLVFSIDEYVALDILPAHFRDVLCAAVESRANIVIAGGTNSGKTTLANALIRRIAERFPWEHVVILEDTVELQCAAPDHVALRTGASLTLAQLVKASMRASPNRIIVGEVRGAEALDLLDAWSTGHPGGVATCHASSAEGVLLRLDRLAQRANVPSQRLLIAEVVNLVAVIRGGNGGRRVTDLARVVGLDSDQRFVLQHLDDKGEWV